ncbi:AraC family transcriptional regulator [Phaeobacter sp. QD34_3]|uniref:helix-turn-helix transcriptional regulator n=1 Tax=unclassified Phaeobacter TaxID=2621772 RepID=UPI00237F49CD|nr:MULTISPECIES: AraC family transcriptional regulator [unclassified Phaeobacter]MDE4133772.1 AraC family transcriptional regulator [Phaeobacter sp. QD34_3]MDE4137295.1 AraC family transcriptional regulator [Phaeobacter sp. QD34_24]
MDRLSSLMARFRMAVDLAEPETATLLAYGDGAAGLSHLVFHPGTPAAPPAPQACLALRVEWAGAHNPLVAALPDRVEVQLDQAPELRAVLDLIRQEVELRRCGAQSILAGLGQAAMVRLLRHLIEVGTTQPGLLAGLSDLRLARAIVAMHDHPGRVWTMQDLASEAGLSPSRFSELFAQQLGETPISYLRRWRLTLARQDLLRGDRVEAVARRYAYETPEGFTRAFRRAYGCAPVSLRKGAA